MSKITSHPLWVCGLKFYLVYSFCHHLFVTPFMGVWIEILWCYRVHNARSGHTLYGCVDWNKLCKILSWLLASHTLYGCVDWNHISKVCTNGAYQSHPLWVCGLKSFLSLSPVHWQMSHPLWVCGLKYVSLDADSMLVSHTLYGCVDWNHAGAARSSASISHTLYGCVDWNNPVSFTVHFYCRSHPLWVCGLKYAIIINHKWPDGSHPLWVCGLKLKAGGTGWQMEASHPLWVCGLKLPTSEP